MSGMNLSGFWNPKIAAAMGADRKRVKAAIAFRGEKKKRKAAKKKRAHAPKASIGADFRKSLAWRQLRYLALVNCGGRCQCCGASANDGVVLHVDHIKPASVYPELALCLDNIQVLCDDCNIGKGSWDSTDWRGHINSI